MRNGFPNLLHAQTYPLPPLLLVVSHHHQQWPAFVSINPTPVFPRWIRTQNRRWDSNAETFRTRNFDFRSLDEEDEDDFEDDDTNQWFDILEDFIDGVWIFKVFRSYGWMLPAIISSLLLASGPKAFLMAMALPLGQSALSFVFQLVWGRPKNKTKRKGKSNTKPPPPPRRTPRAASYANPDDVKGETKGAMGYQTWVAGDDVSSDKKSNDSSTFGGWEELDRGAKFSTESTKNSNEKRKTPKGKLSRRERRSDTPLLLRLLIAVFPFLGTWTRML